MSIISKEEFLSLFPGYILVTAKFTQKKREIYHNATIDTCRLHNTPQYKKDIYFTPNGDYASYFKDNRGKDALVGRTEDNATKINCFFVEIDNKNKGWELLDLDPTCVVETKNGYHIYYVLNETVTLDLLSRRKKVQENMVEMFDGDKKAKDIARVMRVPEFMYWKDNKGETEIVVASYDADNRYGFDDFEKAVKNTYSASVSDKIEHQSLKRRFRKNDSFFDRVFNDISNIDVVDVLSDLSGGRYTVHSNGTIYEGDRRTNGYKRNKYGNYVNNFAEGSDGDRPNGGPWSVAKFYIKNAQERFDYFNDRRGIDIDRGKFDITKLAQNRVLETADTVESSSTTFGDSLCGIVVDRRKQCIYGYQGDEETKVFINGMITPLGYAKVEDEVRYILRIDRGDVVSYSMLPYAATGTEMRKFLMKYGLINQDNGRWHLLLLEYVFSTAKDPYFYTNKLGQQYSDDGDRYVIEKGGVYVDEKNKVFVDMKDMAGWEINISEGSDANLVEYMDMLKEGYDGRVSIPAFYSVVMGLNAYWFRKNSIQLPQLFLLGLSGSGKTTFLNQLFRSIGIKKDIAAMSKAFIYEKMARHYIPFHLSEYRHNAHQERERVEGLMRNIFDSSPIIKGRSDQSISIYESNAMYCFCGQSHFTDDAVLTRMIMLMGNKPLRGDISCLISLPKVGGKILDIFQKQEDFIKFLKMSKQAFKELNEQFELSRSNDRMMTSYSYMVALDRMLGFNHMEYFLEALGTQDSLTAVDDIKNVYQKVLNLQSIYNFDMQVYRKGLVIHIVEEGIRTKMDFENLKGFINTVNHNFLGDNDLFGLSTYIDLDYIYKNKTLRPALVRALMRFNVDVLALDEEDRAVIRSLSQFLKTNFPNSSVWSEMSIDVKIRDGGQNKDFYGLS